MVHSCTAVPRVLYVLLCPDAASVALGVRKKERGANGNDPSRREKLQQLNDGESLAELSSIHRAL